MCGIAGIIGKREVSTELYESLIALQHRGQDAAGIATYNDGLHLRKDNGLVRDVFQQRHIETLRGTMGIGQVRYPTMGSVSSKDAQPFYTNSPYGIAMAHNGNIFNFEALKAELFEKDLRHINSCNDVEVLLNVFASELSSHAGGSFFDSLCLSVKSVFNRVKGAYSVVGFIAGKGLIAFRDPHGIRPLVWGQRKNGGTVEHIFASENTMFEFLDYEFYKDVDPGSLVFVDMKGNVHTKIIKQKEFRPCSFEYVYFARPDAYLNGVSVYRARLRMGQNLAEKIKKQFPKFNVDIVIPAPQTANTSALSCAYNLGVRYSEGLVKNSFVGRTFIMPDQTSRVRANKYKLSVIDFEVANKNVLIVDDSVVRGNASKNIVSLIRSHGAKKVYFASASPPIKWPDMYGIDMPSQDELIAYNRTADEIKELIGADELIYQDLGDLEEAIMRRGDIKFKKAHYAYFDGDFPTGDINLETIKLNTLTREKHRLHKE